MAKQFDSRHKLARISSIVVRGSKIGEKQDAIPRLNREEHGAPVRRPTQQRPKRSEEMPKNPPPGDFLSVEADDVLTSNKVELPSYILDQCISAEEGYLNKLNSLSNTSLQELWLVVKPQAIALQGYALVRDIASKEPVIIYENRRVIAVNNVARKLGVCNDTPLATAMSLTDGCTMLQRRPLLERKLLKSIALTLERFSNELCITDDCVVLEVGRSRELFNGVEVIVKSIWQHFNRANIAITMGADATVQRAVWQSCANELNVISRKKMTLSELPINVMNIRPKEIERLHAMGIYNYRDIKRLPRSELNERISPELREMLARAEGDKPDLRIRYQRPRRFALKVEFDYPVEVVDHLMPILNQGIWQLCTELRYYQKGVRNIAIGLVNIHKDMSWHLIRLSQLVYQLEQIRPLVEQKLQGLVIEAPVDGFCIITGKYLHLVSKTVDLFDNVGLGGEGERLMDLLVSRLGEEGVMRIFSYGDHLPERQTRYSGALQKHQDSIYVANSITKVGLQPPWLFEEPIKLYQQRIKGESFTLIHYPVRIETGWWRNEWSSRDYYTAITELGKRYWIFSENEKWYLHGQFF